MSDSDSSPQPTGEQPQPAPLIPPPPAAADTGYVPVPPGGPEQPPPGWAGQPPAPTGLRRLSGFQRGLLAGLAVAVVIGLVAWFTSGHGGKAGTVAATAAAPAGPGLPSAVVSSPSKHHKGKSGSAAGGGPMPVFTPGGPEPALVPAASLAAVTAADPSVTCPAATVNVGNAADLTAAMSAAGPGTVIQLADGTYSGNFSSSAVGTAAQPVFLCGGPGAVLDAGSTQTSGGYVLHLQNGAYWRLVGFTVQDGQKGVVLDHTDYSVVQGLTVQHVGDEAIHLREFSDDDLVLNNTVKDTGSLNPKFGEGVYIGTAKSNWCTYTACQPDNSDNDVIRGNTISQTTAENVDIKEGTSGGALIANSFDGAGLSPKGATAWVNAKGNGYLIKGNTGHNSPQDGFQTHQILPGWGQDNVFQANTAVVNGSGYGFNFSSGSGNVWTCDNTVQGAARGNGSTACGAAP